MSRMVDEKVVSMQFDNAQFERNVQTSINTLDNLKQSLKFDGAARGLENINAATKNFDASPLANGVEVIQAKFSALEVMAVTALANITNSAVNAGKRLVASFTIEPMKTGFQEYETQINAVQTILSNTRSKGTTLDQVNDALDELNHYADMTIYNFTEMTRNIGTFTAAGVDLDTSVSAIKGIANLAAVSGSTSQQASTAMYQLSQALAAGTVKLQDWNSVVNAGMGGQVFQDALKETARVHGIAIDQMIESEGSFRETLSKGWLTSEILTETLSKFTGDLTEEQIKSMGYTDEQAKAIMALGEDANNAATKVKTFTQLLDTLKEAAQSGWTQTWEYIIGDFEDAKKLWTSVSDTLSEMINQSAEARNKVVGEWAENGGRAAAIEAIKNAFEGLMNIIKPIKEAFSDIFPPTTSEQLIKITKKIRDLTQAFKEWTDNNADKIRSTFEGLFSVLKIGVTVIKAIVSGIAQLIGKITGLSGGILGVTASLGEWISGVAKSITETNLFGKAIDKIVGFLDNAIDKIKDFFSTIGEKVDSSGLDGFLNVLENIWEFIANIGKKIGSAFGNFFRSGDLKNAMQILNTGLITSILLGVKKFMGNGSLDGIKEFFDGLLSPLENLKDKLRPVSGMLDELKGCLVAYQNDLKANTLIKLAVAIGILAAAIFTLSTIEPEKLGNALSGMAVLFIELVGAIAAIEKFGGQYKNSKKAVMTMTGLSVSLLILASALKKIAELQWDELARGLTGVLGLMVILVAAAKIMSTNSKRIKKGATQMVIMSLALKILASVCKDLSALSWEGLAKGVAGVSGILLAVAGFQELTKLIKPKKIFSSAASLVIIGAAMEIFADVCKKFKDIDWSALGKAGVAMGGVLLLASGFALLSGLSKKIKSSSVALVVIGAAMEIFADVCQKFGNMEWESLGKAGAAISGLLVLAAGFTLLSGLSKKMTRSVVGLTIIAVTMEIFADVCRKFGSMEWDALGKAGASIAGILALCIGFTLLAGLSSGIIKSASALLIMAAALAIMAPVLKTLGGMSWGGIAKGLVAIAGAFAIIGIAGLLLKPIVPIILALSASVALLGVACLAFGAGVTLLASGIAALAVALGAGAVAIAEGILTILRSLNDAIVLICEAIIGSIGYIEQALIALVEAGVNVLVTCIPAIAEGVMQLVVGVLEALVQYTPQIVNYLFDFLIGLINATAERLPELIQAVVNFLGKLFSGIIEALRGIDPEVLLKAVAAVGLLSAFMLVLNAVSGLVPGAMVGVLGVGAVIAELALVLAAIGALAQIPGLDWLVTEGGNFLQKIGTAIGQFIGGIIGGIGKGIMDTIGNGLVNLGTSLTQFMENASGFFDRLDGIKPEQVTAVASIADMVLKLSEAAFLSGINSIISFGTGSFKSLGEQLGAFADSLFGTDGNGGFIAKINKISKEDIEHAENVCAIISTFAEASSKIPNTGGLLGLIVGNNDLDKFGKGISDFADTMCGEDGFLAKIRDITDTDPIHAQYVGDIIKTFATVSQEIPNTGGLLGLLVGNNDLKDFGEGISDFVNTMCGENGFLPKIREITESDTTCAKYVGDIIKTFANVAQEIPEAGGLLSLFVGNNDLKDFGEGISDFTDTMIGENGFLPKIREVTESDVAYAGYVCDIISRFSDVANQVSDSKSFWDNFKNGSLAAFGYDLSGFGGYYKTYSESISGISFGQVATSIDQVNNLVAMCKGMEGIDTSKMANFAKDLKTLGNSGIDEFIGAFQNSGQKIQNAVTTMLNNFINAANAKLYGIKTCFKNLATGALNSLNDSLSEFSDAGSDAAKNFGTNAVSSIRDYYNSFYYAGKYVVEGLAEGINDYTYKATNAAKNMSKAVYDTSRSYLDINSPSKLFRSMARCIPEGMAQGIEHESWMVRDAATAMANDAVQGTSRAITRIADLVSMDIDTQPTIRPVLDLSDISKGTDYINGLFETSPSIGVMSNVRSISSMMNNRQNESNGDVIAAIHDLGKQINKSSGDTYSINGITYNGDSDVSDAIRTLVRAARIEGRT